MRCQSGGRTPSSRSAAERGKLGLKVVCSARARSGPDAACPNERPRRAITACPGPPRRVEAQDGQWDRERLAALAMMAKAQGDAARDWSAALPLLRDVVRIGRERFDAGCPGQQANVRFLVAVHISTQSGSQGDLWQSRPR